jgi:hypothetical protein
MQLTEVGKCPASEETGSHPQKILGLASAQKCTGFLCINDRHAFAIRHIHGRWTLLDSNLSKPVTVHTSMPLPTLGGMMMPYKLYKLSDLQPAPPANHITHTQAQPYMEAQERSFCMVHAFNMVLGEHMFSGDTVLRHILALANSFSNRMTQAAQFKSKNLPRLNLQQFYTPNQGDFSAIISNHFLYRQNWNLGTIYFLKYTHQNLKRARYVLNW